MIKNSPFRRTSNWVCWARTENCIHECSHDYPQWEGHFAYACNTGIIYRGDLDAIRHHGHNLSLMLTSLYERLLIRLCVDFAFQKDRWWELSYFVNCDLQVYIQRRFQKHGDICWCWWMKRACNFELLIYLVRWRLNCVWIWWLFSAPSFSFFLTASISVCVEHILCIGVEGPEPVELLYNVVWRLLFGWCLKTECTEVIYAQR